MPWIFCLWLCLIHLLSLMSLPPASPLTPASALPARLAFRAAGRRVLRSPTDGVAHAARLQAACALTGGEAAQGALADWLYACPGQLQAQKQALRQAALQRSLGAVVWRQFVRQLHLAAQRSGAQMQPRVQRMATRWSVLVQPSSDVPQRALLCGADDSQGAAQAAVAAILAGDTAQEAAFLAHCTGAQDSLAFMLARRSLQRAGFNFSPAWQDAMRVLQQGGRA